MTNRRFNNWNWSGQRKGRMKYSWANRYHDFMYWRHKDSRKDCVENLSKDYRRIIFQMNLEDFNGIK